VIINEKKLDSLQDGVALAISGGSFPTMPEWFFDNFFLQQVASIKIIKKSVSVKDFLIAVEAAFWAACLVVEAGVPAKEDIENIFQKVLSCAEKIDPVLAQSITLTLARRKAKKEREQAVWSKSGAILNSWKERNFL
jgi:hypothetical protein